MKRLQLDLTTNHSTDSDRKYQCQKKKTEKSDREIWCDVMYRMAAPVLSNMSEGLLKQNMLVELSPMGRARIRTSLIWNASVA